MNELKEKFSKAGKAASNRREALKLAGKLATAAEQVLKCNSMALGVTLCALEDALHNYNNYIFNDVDDKEVVRDELYWLTKAKEEGYHWADKAIELLNPVVKDWRPDSLYGALINAFSWKMSGVKETPELSECYWEAVCNDLKAKGK